MAAQQGFPRTLLEQSVLERRQYFRDYTIAHPHLVEVYRRLRDEMTTVDPGTLIFVCGPSGIGKTTLLHRVEQKLTDEMRIELEQDLARVPIVTVEALSPETGNFNWKDFYRRLLIKLDEPCIERKVAPYLQTAEYQRQKQMFIGDKPAGAVLRHSAEQVLKHRRPVALCIDEAQHLASITSGRKLQNQLDCIKSLSNATGIPIVLCGHYELLIFRNLSAQLSRRSVDLHFRRYRADDKKELQAFKNVVWSFERHLPLEEKPELIGQWDYLYERSLGCVGVLKLWLSKALAAALKDVGQRLTLQHLQKTALSISRCEKLLSDLREGENLLAEPKAASHQFRVRLGLDSAPNQSQGPSQEIDTLTAPRQKRLPGQRRPKRDPIGADQ